MNISSRSLIIIASFLFILLLGILGFIFIPSPAIMSPPLPLFSPLIVSPHTPLEIIFDRPISRELKPKLIPAVPGKWKFQTGRFGIFFTDRLTFYPESELKSNQEYIVSLERVLPVTWLSLNQAERYLFIFSTPPQTLAIAPPEVPTPSIKHVQLDVPLIKQHYTFTCYSAASQMVLSYRGVNTISELGFLDEIGFDSTARQYTPNIWGDPSQGIVGTYNGVGGGYGVHWQPVANALKKYRTVAVKENWTTAELLRSVESGNPVMVWWINGVWPAKELFWQSAEGQKVRAVNGVHVEVVTGFVGSPENPSVIYTNDPWRGYRQYNPEVFETLWKWFNNTAIIIY
jgi:uncharacterized protein YvpB